MTVSASVKYQLSITVYDHDMLLVPESITYNISVYILDLDVIFQ